MLNNNYICDIKRFSLCGGKKMTTLNIELPDKIFSVMRFAPEEFKNEMRLAAAAMWYEQGKVSQEMAAKIAGMNRTDFLLSLARMGKDSFQVDFADLDKELARG
jgi:predicted HTH domain antitoxin